MVADMADIIVRESTPEDICYIADHLREADQIEVRLSQSEEPAFAVRKSCLDSNWCKCALVDGVPTVLYGVTPTDAPECGSPWMLATDGIAKIKREFLIGSMQEIGEMRQAYRYLFNQVHRDNAISIKWLKWLGFWVDETPAGPLGEFYNFWYGVN